MLSLAVTNAASTARSPASSMSSTARGSGFSLRLHMFAASRVRACRSSSTAMTRSPRATSVSIQNDGCSPSSVGSSSQRASETGPWSPSHGRKPSPKSPENATPRSSERANPTCCSYSFCRRCGVSPRGISTTPSEPTNTAPREESLTSLQRAIGGGWSCVQGTTDSKRGAPGRARTRPALRSP